METMRGTCSARVMIRNPLNYVVDTTTTTKKPLGKCELRGTTENEARQWEGLNVFVFVFPATRKTRNELAGSELDSSATNWAENRSIVLCVLFSEAEKGKKGIYTSK